MSQYVPKFYEVVGPLEYEWQLDPAATAEKFRQFIRYHEHMEQEFVASLYRNALAQLLRGVSTQVIGVLNLSNEQLKKELGI